ncbi:hypothetical protein [Rhizobium sp. L1K21]|uniref:DUF4870 family protein n=1 Tax=Rhizobium sp. L1K21 TaxID=2954933 RepID=UPI002093B956|nr:hypothetical protein [Rhizobium sp. L1K21]MCO6187000.1 hypothetical protein [Rhizobium sp. L1K21]
MSENQPQSFDAQGLLEPGKSNIQLIYALYLLGFIVGITPLIAVVLAYLNRGKASGIYESHYIWAIRTFWIGLLFALISGVLTLIVIGVLAAIATAVWMIVRCVIGLQKIGRNEAIDNPQSWLI